MKKLNKFDAFMLCGFVALIVLGIVLVTKLHNKEQEFIDSINEKYYEPDTNLVGIYADGVIDFTYRTQDGEYIIEYCDEDAFDQDDMLWNEKYHYYYIEIYADSAEFYDYLNWYNSIEGRYDDKFTMSCPKFGIIETATSDDVPYYKLQRRRNY